MLCGTLEAPAMPVHILGKEGAQVSRKLAFALGALSLIWGGSFFFIKILLHDGFGPWSIAFLRSSFGLVGLAVIMLAIRQPFHFTRIPWVRMIVMALINTAIPWAFIGFSETRIASSMASALNTMTPIWTLIIGVIFFKLASSRLQWIGMTVSTVGLIVLLDINPVSIVSIDLIGFLCMMTATLCYGFGTQLSKKLTETLTMYQTAFGTLLVSSIGSGIAALTTESIPVDRLIAPASLGALLGLGVLGSGVAYILFYYLVQKGSAQIASMVTYLVPVTAIIWGFTLLDEEIHWSLLAGLVLILTGVYLASKKIPGTLTPSKSSSL